MIGCVLRSGDEQADHLGGLVHIHVVCGTRARTQQLIRAMRPYASVMTLHDASVRSGPEPGVLLFLAEDRALPASLFSHDEFNRLPAVLMAPDEWLSRWQSSLVALQLRATVSAGSPVQAIAGALLAVAHGYEVRRRPDPADTRPSDCSDLPARAWDVFRLIHLGYTNREIAAELSLSTSTVKHYVSRILCLLGMRNRVEAARLYPSTVPDEHLSVGSRPASV
jgi:DNA-binding CsgD family transcriptional regulator